ncbi:MAG: hypothetical protein KF895_03105 [Parvibaculum sp.]|nr:hypothetical protein [Parvibaculum sp.]
MKFWNASAIERFTALHAAGKTDSQIAAAMGISRNSVISRRRALGLPVNSVAGVRPMKGATRPEKPPRNAKTAWTGDRIATLRKMWADGAKTEVIAAELGFKSASAISMKAKELGLPSRKDARNRLKAEYRGQGFAQDKGPKAEPAPVRETCVVQSMTFAMVKGLPHALVDRHPRQCGWPIGNPTEPDFHFCTNERLAGQTYCEGHMRAMRTAYAPERRPKHSAIDFARYE